MSPAERALLRQLAHGRSRADLERLIALIRRTDDAELTLAAFEPPPAKLRRPRDPLTEEVDQTLAPLLARAAEKADLLIAEAQRGRRAAPEIMAKGVASAVRKLRALYGEDGVRSAARALMARIAREHDPRETVI